MANYVSLIRIRLIKLYLDPSKSLCMLNMPFLTIPVGGRWPVGNTLRLKPASYAELGYYPNWGWPPFLRPIFWKIYFWHSVEILGCETYILYYPYYSLRVRGTYSSKENSLPHCPQGYLIPSCTALWCLVRLSPVYNCLPHCPQGYLIPSCTAPRCSARYPSLDNCFPNFPQGYLIPICTALWCPARFSSLENCLPHYPQGYLIPSCTALWCLARYPFSENSLPHCLQGYLIPSCTALWCLATSPFLEYCLPHSECLFLKICLVLGSFHTNLSPKLNDVFFSPKITYPTINLGINQLN